MPMHKAEPFCLKEKDVKTHDACSCQHCTLAVCRVCGSYEGGLTQDCPGVKVSSDVAALVYEGGLDYTDEKGWFVWEKSLLKSHEWNMRRVKFEPTSKDIIRRLAGLLPNETGAKLDSLKADAKYWMEHGEFRR